MKEQTFRILPLRGNNCSLNSAKHTGTTIGELGGKQIKTGVGEIIMCFRPLGTILRNTLCLKYLLCRHINMSYFHEAR